MIDHIRCSGLARPMVCAGYTALDVEELDSDNYAAKEGTAAGEFAQLTIEKKPIPLAASNGVIFDEDMKFYTLPIVADMQNRAVGPILCETRIDWQTRSGITIKGTYDYSFIDKRDYLCMEDLKYGFGIVEVKENWQIIAYAIGECIRRGRGFTHIAFTIHQPRPHHEDGYSREWVITYAQLLEYKERIEVRMQEIADGKKDFQTSSKCKYCKGAAEACPAFSRLFYRALEVSQEFFQDSLTEAEIATQLDQCARYEEVLKIKKDSLVQLGNDRIKKGKLIPGYIQDNQYSHREWKPGISPLSVQVMTGIDIMERSLMTPAKAEKAGLSKKFTEQMSATRLTGVKLKKGGANSGNKIFGNTNPIGGN